MTVHPVQVPNPCVPYSQLDPVTGPLVHLATKLSAIYAETACSGVPVKTGKEKSVIPTQTNIFLAECVDLYQANTSVLCKAVPVTECPRTLSLVHHIFPSALFLLLLKLTPLLQQGLQLLNTQRMVTKPF